MVSSYRKIWQLLLPGERRRLVLLMGITLIMAIFEVVGVGIIMPFLAVVSDASLLESNAVLRTYVAVLGIEDPRNGQIAVGLGALSIIVVGMMVRALATYLQFKFALMRSYSLASRLLHGFLSQDYVWHVSRNSADMSTSVLTEVDQVVRESILPAVLLVSNLLIVTLIAGLIFVVSPGVAIGMTLLLAVVYMAVFFLLRHRLTRIGEARARANKGRFRAIQDVTSGLKELKILGIERQSLQQFRQPAEQMAQNQTMSQIYARLPRFAVEGVLYCAFILAALVVVLLGQAQIEDSLPLLGLLGMAALRMFPALQTSYQQVSLLRFSAPVLDRVLAKVNEAQIRPLPAPPDPLPLKQAITLRDISFRYPGAERNSLESISFEIPRRGTIGLVGGTGAGKTTLVDILLGLLHPDAGSVCVDDVALGPETLRAWQRSVGYVPQQIFLLDDSVAANIAFGSAGPVDLAQVEKAARAAQLHEFITTELPNGYQTPVGEAGVRLSGGQRQRIGIARALYRDPEVLFLDEATSALDNLTEKAVMEAVDSLSGEKTIIMIAHRLSTVRNCENILFLEKGRISAQGRYDELVENSAGFRKIAHA